MSSQRSRDVTPVCCVYRSKYMSTYVYQFRSQSLSVTVITSPSPWSLSFTLRTLSSCQPSYRHLMAKEGANTVWMLSLQQPNPRSGTELWCQPEIRRDRGHFDNHRITSSDPGHFHMWPLNQIWRKCLLIRTIYGPLQSAAWAKVMTTYVSYISQKLDNG